MQIDICLATYNGAPWIKDFLNSLDAQTFRGWRLVVSDDASKDGTLELIKTHFAGAPEKLIVAPRVRTGVGLVRNFQDAIAASTAPYILLADQDDIWLPQKLEVMFALMRNYEHDRSGPVLIFSDLEVVDASLRLLNRSWWSYISSSPTWATSFKKLLCQNVVPGCSMMLNRSLVERAMPFPEGVIMHDWWLLLVSAAFGQVGICGIPLVRYRRHTGAQTYWAKESVWAKLHRYVWGGYCRERNEIRKQYGRTVAQAQAFEEVFGNQLGATTAGRGYLQVLRMYINAAGKGWWRKRLLLVRNNIHLSTPLHTAKFYAWI